MFSVDCAQGEIAAWQRAFARYHLQDDRVPSDFDKQGRSRMLPGTLWFPEAAINQQDDIIPSRELLVSFL